MKFRVHVPTEQPIIGFSGFVFKRRFQVVDIVIFKLLTPRIDVFSFLSVLVGFSIV